MQAAELDLDLCQRDLVVSLFSPFTSSRSLIKARASGVLLVAGVGSYCAYRICTKFLGQRFVYMLLEASHVDHLATADRRLLYNQTEAANEDAVEDEEQDDNEWMERVSSAAGSQFSRMSRFRHSASRGLFAIRSRPRSREGVLSRRSNSGKTLSIAGSGTSVGSGRSASLQIVWEAPGTMVSTSRSARILPVGNPRPDLAAPSIGDLCSVFDDVMSVVSAVDNTDDPLMFQQHGDPDEEDVVNCTIKCMTDSKYMYRSVLDDDIASEAGSMISRRSSLMRLSNARRMTAASTGLWSLASEEPSTSKGLLEISQTESTMTKSFNSKRSSNNRSMFDSAIGADLSSEEGSLDLNKLEPLSENGMEWCDDDLLPIPSSRNGFDWDMESTREGVTVSPLHRPNSSRDLMAFACQRYPPCSPQFKLLHTLYHRNRLRRIGCSTEETMAGQKQLELLLQAALYHRRRIVQDMTWLELEQRLEQRFGECDFLQRWPGRTKRDLQRYLRLLWDLIEFTGCGVEEGHIKGLEVLLVMESIEVYNEKMARGLTDWFEHDSPSTILERIHNGASLDSTSWTLASRCFDTSIEIIDVSLASQQPKYTTYGTSSATLHWLKYGASPVPLFLVPEF